MPSVAKKLVIVKNDEPAPADEQVIVQDDSEDVTSGQAAEPAARPEELRLLEALLFAAAEPLDEPTLVRQLPDGVNVKEALAALKAEYAPRGVNLVKIGRKTS